jgi:hypothetical protein
MHCTIKDILGDSCHVHRQPIVNGQGTNAGTSALPPQHGKYLHVTKVCHVYSSTECHLLYIPPSPIECEFGEVQTPPELGTPV